VGLRISGTDWVEGGWDIEQSIAYVRAAQEFGIAYVCVSSGGVRAKVTVPAAPNYQVPLAHAVRQATGVPTRAVGLITDPRQAEQILEAGSADMIALARAFLDDPRWGWHAADVLGAKAHFPPQYHLARSEGWRRIRDQNACGSGFSPTNQKSG
jgi:NADPH2 dehydrogenase